MAQRPHVLNSYLPYSFTFLSLSIYTYIYICPSLSPEASQGRLRHIVTTYIVDDEVKSVNISNQERDEIMNAYEKEDYTELYQVCVYMCVYIYMYVSLYMYICGSPHRYTGSRYHPCHIVSTVH